MAIRVTGPGTAAAAILPGPPPPPLGGTYDLGGTLVSENGVQRVWRAASSPISSSAPAALPDLAGSAGTLANSGAINNGTGAIGNYVSGQPAIMIGQLQTGSSGADHSHRLYREAYTTYITGAPPTVPANTGTGVTLNTMDTNGFTSPAGTAIYALNSTGGTPGPQQTISYGFATTLSSSISAAGGALTSLPVAATTNSLPAGSVITVGSGTTQTWTTTSLVGVGAFNIPVTSQTPNSTYASGTTVFKQGVTASAWPGTKGALTNVTCAAGSFTPVADVAVVPSTRTVYDTSMLASGTFDFSTGNLVFVNVVRPADMLHRGIGGSGTGDESGIRRSLCVFSSVASGAPAGNPGLGQVIYCMIDPSNTVSGAYKPFGHVRFGFGSGREVVVNDAVRIGRASIIICQWDGTNAKIWVGTRGASDVVTASAAISGPSAIGTTANYRVGNVTMIDPLNSGAGSKLYSFHGYWGLSAIVKPTTAWTTTKARNMWIQAGLDTGDPTHRSGFFGGGLPFTAAIGRDYAPVLQATATDTSTTWRGTTAAVQAPLDFATYLAGNNFSGPNTNDFSTPIYIVDENTPDVAFNHTATPVPFADQTMAFQQGVPIPPGAMPALGTDSSITIWRPSTDEYWDMWSAQPDWYHTGAPIAGANAGSYNNGRWHSGFGAWQTNMSRLPGPFDGGYSSLGGAGGWGASAPKIPYWKSAGRRITEMLAGTLNGPLLIEGSTNFIPPALSLVSSVAAGTASAGIANNSSFTGLPGDTIVVDDANGFPQFGATDTNFGTITALTTLNTLTGGATQALPVSKTDGPGSSVLTSPTTGTIWVYTDSGPVALTYSAKPNTTTFTITGGGSGQTVQAGAPWGIFQPTTRTITWGILQIGAEFFTYGLLVQSGSTHTFKYVRNVTNPGTTLSTGLSGQVTSLPVTSLSTALISGQSISTVSGTHIQTWVTTAAVPISAGATSIPVQQQGVSPSYTAGTTVTWPNACQSTAALPTQSGALTQPHSATTAVTRMAGSNSPAQMPQLHNDWPWPGNASDGHAFSPSTIREGQVFRIPSGVTLNALPGSYTYRSWTRPATLDTFTLMLAKAAQDHGVIVMDIAGSTIPIELEDPWEWTKANGMNPYTGSVEVLQATGAPVGNTVPVTATSGLVASGTGGNPANLPTYKAYVPQRGVTFTFNSWVSGTSLTNAIGDPNFSTIQNGDWIIVQGTSTNATGVPFASVPAGLAGFPTYQSLYPSGTSALPGTTGLFRGIARGTLGRNFPWDLLELVDPVDLKARVG